MPATRTGVKRQCAPSCIAWLDVPRGRSSSCKRVIDWATSAARSGYPASRDGSHAGRAVIERPEVSADVGAEPDATSETF